MAMTWEQKCQLLFEESDGVKFDARVKRLKRAGSRAQLIDLLSSYVVQGQLLHWRGFLCADLAEMAEPTDAALGDRFATWLTSDHGADVQYWAWFGCEAGQRSPPSSLSPPTRTPPRMCGRTP